MESKFIESGIIEKTVISDDKYYSLEGFVSASMMKQLKRSPAHFKEWKDAPEEEESEALIFGRAYHCFVLEPDEFAQRFYVLDDKEIVAKLIEGGSKRPAATKEYSEWLQKESAIASGRTLVSAADFDTIKAMRSELMHHRYARMLITQGENEVAFTGKLETQAGPVPVKMKLDKVNEAKRAIVDLKTTRNADANIYPKLASDTELQIQAAFYSDMMELYSGDGRPWSFYFIAQEKYPPYAFNIFEASPQFINQGRYEYELLISLWRYCVANDIWPSYQVFCQNKFGIVELNLPAYKIRPLEYYIHKI